jgi:hypothetical protein
MIGIDSNYCTVFELDLFFEKARIRVKDLGNCIEVSTMEESRVHKGYKVLGPPSQAHVSLDHSMKYSYENIFHFLEGNETLKCTGRDALDSLEICLELKGKLK